MDLSSDNVSKHTQSTVKDALFITFAMIAALLAAEGRMPDFSRIAKFFAIYTLLVIVLKISHGEVAKQLTTAAAIGCGSKLLEVITKK